MEDFTRGDGTGGESIYGPTFPDEDFKRKHDAEYLLSMANRGKHTNSSQFFITCIPTPHLNGKHVVFGRVVGGQDVVRTIENLPCGPKDRPMEPVTITSCGELERVVKSKSSDDKARADDRGKAKKRDRSAEPDEDGRKSKKKTKKRRSPSPSSSSSADSSSESDSLSDDSSDESSSSSEEHRKKKKKKRSKSKSKKSSKKSKKSKSKSKSKKKKAASSSSSSSDSDSDESDADIELKKKIAALRAPRSFLDRGGRDMGQGYRHQRREGSRQGDRDSDRSRRSSEVDVRAGHSEKEQPEQRKRVFDRLGPPKDPEGRTIRGRGAMRYRRDWNTRDEHHAPPRRSGEDNEKHRIENGHGDARNERTNDRGSPARGPSPSKPDSTPEERRQTHDKPDDGQTSNREDDDLPDDDLDGEEQLVQL
ncbi:hypothetical protein HK102_000097 [Quaeritorhiza haematococci]|nr:hypothetical protein HK102_000097 [Quaeritorhiza haematococci]